ncbi:hypothetical protein B7494_g3729 [Chlorociboria aeruginascens]|nr:hypothetical protein B7494_g3729 [Chlorociboria aeruginascens]
MGSTPEKPGFVDLTQGASSDEEEVADDGNARSRSRIGQDWDVDRYEYSSMYGGHHNPHALTTGTFGGAATALLQLPRPEFLLSAAPRASRPPLNQAISFRLSRPSIARSSVQPPVNIVQPFRNIEQEVLCRGAYNRNSIARDVLVTIGAHPSSPALNEHLLPLRRAGWADDSANLLTLRWDVVEATRPSHDSMPPAIRDDEKGHNVVENPPGPKLLNSSNLDSASSGQNRPPYPLIDQVRHFSHHRPPTIIGGGSSLGLGQKQATPLMAQSPSHTVHRGSDLDPNPLAGHTHAHPPNLHGGFGALDHSRPQPLAAQFQSRAFTTATVQKTVTPSTVSQPQIIHPHPIQEVPTAFTRQIPGNSSSRRVSVPNTVTRASEDNRPLVSNASTSRPLPYLGRTPITVNTGVSSRGGCSSRGGWPSLNRPLSAITPNHSRLASSAGISTPSRRGRPPKMASPIDHTPLQRLVASTSTPSRRGRPPKMATPIDHSRLASSAGTNTPSPRRGRPSKMAAPIDPTRSATEESSKPIESIETPVKDGAETPVGKKRGRPFKNSEPAPGKEGPPKKRGRPAKQPGAAVVVNSEPKKRGRPFKHPEAADEVPVPEPKFNTFICEWKGCPAELHNLETLRSHIFSVHGRKQLSGVFPCLWANCSLMDEVMDEDTLSPKVVDKRFEFKTKDEFQRHINRAHLVSFAWHMGDGPRGTSLGTQKSDSETSYSWLNDAMGNQITPSVKNQPIEEGRARENNARRFEKKLEGIYVVLTPKKLAKGTYTVCNEVDEDEAKDETEAETAVINSN